MSSDYDVIVGMPFLSHANLVIDWTLKHRKTPDMIFPKVCEDKNRQVSLNIISANKMAKSIKKNADPSTKYFLAILKKEYDFIELNTINVDINSHIQESINKIETDFGQEFT